jgi:hypothetical protein
MDEYLSLLKCSLCWSETGSLAPSALAAALPECRRGSERWAHQSPPRTAGKFHQSAFSSSHTGGSLLCGEPPVTELACCACEGWPIKACAGANANVSTSPCHQLKVSKWVLWHLGSAGTNKYCEHLQCWDTGLSLAFAPHKWLPQGQVAILEHSVRMQKSPGGWSKVCLSCKMSYACLLFLPNLNTAFRAVTHLLRGD